MKSYAEKENIEQDVLELIRYYVGKMFVSYTNVKNYSGLYKDDLESDVCYYIFKTSKDGETFLDKMSKITSLKHLRAFVKKCVMFQMNNKIRDIERKPIMLRLDYKMSEYDDAFESCDNSKDNFEVIADPNVNTERTALIQTAISSVKVEVYDNYLYEYEPGKYKTLDTEDLIWMITRKKSFSAMVESVINKETHKPMSKERLVQVINKEKAKLIKELNKNIEYGG